jgi:hypothetical protein
VAAHEGLHKEATRGDSGDWPFKYDPTSSVRYDFADQRIHRRLRCHASAGHLQIDPRRTAPSAGRQGHAGIAQRYQRCDRQTAPALSPAMDVCSWPVASAGRWKLSDRSDRRPAFGPPASRLIPPSTGLYRSRHSSDWHRQRCSRSRSCPLLREFRSDSWCRERHSVTLSRHRPKRARAAVRVTPSNQSRSRFAFPACHCLHMQIYSCHGRRS